MFISEKELTLHYAEFTQLTEQCSKEEIIKCAKLLALYLSLYKQHFGEITPSSQHVPGDPETSREQSSVLFQQGITEAVEMLKTVLKERSRHRSATLDGASDYIN